MSHEYRNNMFINDFFNPILIVQKFLETATLTDDYSSGTFCKTVAICGAFLIVCLVQAF